MQQAFSTQKSSLEPGNTKLSELNFDKVHCFRMGEDFAEEKSCSCNCNGNGRVSKTEQRVEVSNVNFMVNNSHAQAEKREYPPFFC